MQITEAVSAMLKVISEKPFKKTRGLQNDSLIFKCRKNKAQNDATPSG